MIEVCRGRNTFHKYCNTIYTNKAPHTNIGGEQHKKNRVAYKKQDSDVVYMLKNKENSKEIRSKQEKKEVNS